MILQNLKRYEETLEGFDIAISLTPNATTYLNRAIVQIVLIELEQYQQALSDSKKVL